MRNLLVLMTLLIACAFGQAPPHFEGTWAGALDTGTAKLRLLFHLDPGKDGKLHATVDSIDQGGDAIPVDTVTVTGRTVKLEISSIHGSYTGTLAPDNSAIAGTWTQGADLPLTLHPYVAVKPSDIDGTWQGALDTGAQKLRIAFHLSTDSDGLHASMDSIDQGAKGIPSSSVNRTGAALTIEFKALSGDYKGTLSSDLTKITGTWTQAGNALPLVLERLKPGAKMEAPRRPQNPVKPYPYTEREVAVANKAANVTLAGTLTIPPGTGPFPAVVLITGSGPQDRDESLLGHKPFLVLSDFLTRKGIAVLRVDDRGTAKSTGDFSVATTEDFAGDVLSEFEFLKIQPEIDPHKIGLIGHSEGGIIAPLVASRHSDVAFIVMMAGTGLPGIDIIESQGRLIRKAAGATDAQIEQQMKVMNAIYEVSKAEPDPAVRLRKILALGERSPEVKDVPKSTVDAQLASVATPWFHFFLDYDPAPALTKVKCPVLAINGANDLQVDPKINLPAIREALEKSGNPNTEVMELPGLNHLFQTSKTGAVSEYASIEETISPSALDLIIKWVLKQTAEQMNFQR